MNDRCGTPLSVMPLTILVCAISLSMAACGDDNVDSPWNLDEPGNYGADEDCNDGVENPVTGECVTPNQAENADDPSNNQNNGEDPEDNQTDDPPDSNSHNNSTEEECGPGDLMGTTCQPGGEPLMNTTVMVSGTDCDGASFEAVTTSDSDGNYAFEDIPSGTHEMTMTTGSFSSTHDVHIDPGSTTDLGPLDERVCLSPESANIAVMEGVFDDMASILDNIGMSYNLYSATEFPHGDIDALTDYDIIFVECSNGLPTQSSFSHTPAQALQYFVQTGGSLYVSDRAFEYVTEVFDDIFVLNEDLRGTSSPIDADVSNPLLSDLLGTDSVSIEMPSQYIFIDDILVDSTIHFEGDFDAIDPIPSRGSDDSTTTVNAPLMAHHRDPINNGRVFFTSFHNSAQAPDKIQDIFEFLVFQL